ncbi:hypothetical protein ARTSIC4J27_3802 [Pseudarthrobacter siccitolerans]|uniref:Uncharacterized protein n=1 Tax=Pseudarthrobacter siccitolerans TaxID=861266 RepID=A0A024H7S5_9MICC|nr:hypothetical protein ARTSIC4J27_3802 [Pseudarthrobacter siccitolerans]
MDKQTSREGQFQDVGISIRRTEKKGNTKRKFPNSGISRVSNYVLTVTAFSC